ncbi:MAG TPA: DUF5666 domain-containing protein [Pusillimonas sp.]|uniref:DUF5666 domain-containing protein n=1 Tax=unclassified Pusillimonas TaxID=2640016 RepID=UPI002628EAA6|nr:MULTISPECIES: DUF5666 domain-containing protein [unclassified Pusillimonas]HLU18590.1 DUF5666 domain-containing protein [Pusillimonas sp.]
MKSTRLLQAVGLALAVSLSSIALANNDQDIEGEIESIDQQAQSFVVGGKTFHADERTDYDDNLKSFSDLKVGQRVEVDYVTREGKQYAKEIELDD